MKIKIRKLRLMDAEILQELFLHEKTLKDTGVNLAKEKITTKLIEKWLKERIDQYYIKKPRFTVYAITNNKNILVGTIGIGSINYKNKSAEIGYWISKENSGKGYCTNAIKIFIKRFPKLFNLKKILAEVSKKDIASYKVLEKNRFKVINKSHKNLLLEKEVKN